MLEVPEDNEITDTVLALGKGVLSLVPGGGLLAETIGLAVSKASRERDLEFWRLVAENLESLEAKVQGLTQKKIADDEQFIAYAHRAMRASQESADEDKRRLLANALSKSGSWSGLAISELDRFTELISRYSMLHIKLLGFMQEPDGWLRANAPAYPAAGIEMRSGGLGSILSEFMFEGSDLYPSEVNRVLKELERDDLIDNPGLNVSMSSAGLLSPRIKPLGTKFLGFLTDDEITPRPGGS